MCRAFSCLVTPKGEVKWELGIDSHSDLAQKFGLRDDRPAHIPFAKVEITPDNGNYIKPDRWTLTIDESVKPEWWTPEDEKACFVEHGKWLRKLNLILVKKDIVHPFALRPPREITRAHLDLLKTWDSVWDSVGDSVVASVGDSVRAIVGNSVWASVRDSVRDSVGDVGDSVWPIMWASVWAQAGSFFRLPRSAWKYTKNIEAEGYPFQAAVKLWEMGLVPSFNGKVWRLHGGKDAGVLWEGEV